MRKLYSHFMNRLKDTSPCRIGKNNNKEQITYFLAAIVFPKCLVTDLFVPMVVLG